METILSIIAIIVSGISLYFCAYPVYCHYMSKDEKTIMTITENMVEGNIIKLCIVYSNVEYRGIIITNSYIMLSAPHSGNTYTYSNDTASRKWISPIIFSDKGNQHIVLEYELPNLENVNINNVDIIVKTNYIDSKGINRCDNCFAGKLVRTASKSIATYVEHIGHTLSGKIIAATFK